MDAGLRAKLRLYWVERHTVAHLTAVATALADLLIDHGKHVRLSLNATFALAPLFRSTLLVVDEHGHSRRGFQLAQGVKIFVAWPQRGDAGKRRPAPALRLLGHHDDPFYALRGETVRQGGDRHTPLRILATRHGDRTVVEQ